MKQNRNIVFISCGQQTERERQLGEQIQALVSELTPFQPYYAEYQSSLEGLTKNIFAALNRCVGFIAVMHHRGRIEPPGSVVRASVWIEQEIAIAAFVRTILGKNIEVAAFTEQTIALEGVRKQLLLNPKEFTENDEVIDHLRSILPAWQAPEAESEPGSLDIALDYEKKNSTQERHDYLLVVSLTNNGNQPVDNWHVDVEFPAALLEHPEKKTYFVGHRSTKTHSVFRVEQFDHGTKIFPGDTLRAITIEYFMDNDTYMRKSDLFQSTARATIYIKGMVPKVVEKSVSQLQNF